MPCYPGQQLTLRLIRYGVIVMSCPLPSLSTTYYSLQNFHLFFFLITGYIKKMKDRYMSGKLK